MKKPVVNYREFRLSRIKEPRFSHLLWLLPWVGYFIAYFLTENLIPREACHIIHSPLDDLIPFCEWFVIPYTFWYLLIVISLLYFALYNPENFKKLMQFIAVTQLVAMIIYVIYPNRQDLRPTEFENDNVLTWIVGFLYSFDTSTNVCPSLHVAYSIGIASVWLKEKLASCGVKVFMVIAAVIISISTAFVKQHSVVDIFAAIPLGILAEAVVFWKYYKKKFKKTA